MIAGDIQQKHCQIEQFPSKDGRKKANFIKESQKKHNKECSKMQFLSKDSKKDVICAKKLLKKYNFHQRIIKDTIFVKSSGEKKCYFCRRIAKKMLFSLKNRKDFWEGIVKKTIFWQRVMKKIILTKDWKERHDFLQKKFYFC